MAEDVPWMWHRKIFNKGFAPSEKSFQCVENDVFWHSKKWGSCKLIVVHFLWVRSLHWCIFYFTNCLLSCLSWVSFLFVLLVFFLSFCIFSILHSFFLGELTSLMHFVFPKLLAWPPDWERIWKLSSDFS